MDDNYSAKNLLTNPDITPREMFIQDSPTRPTPLLLKSNREENTHSKISNDPYSNYQNMLNLNETIDTTLDNKERGRNRDIFKAYNTGNISIRNIKG